MSREQLNAQIPVGLVAIADNGGQRTVEVNPGGHLEVELHGQTIEPFGAVVVAKQTPMFQLDFATNLNTENSISTTYGSATVTTANGLLTCTTGASTNSLASFRPKRVLRYRAGQSFEVRGTVRIPSTPVVGSSLLAGYSSGESGVLIGSVDTVLGVHRTHGGIRQLNTLTVGTKSSNAQVAVVTLGSQTFNVNVTNGATAAATAAELASADYTTKAPGWIASAIGSTVRFVSLVAGDLTALTFSVTFPTSGAGTFATTTAGVASTIETVAQADWDDPLDGTGASGMTLNWAKLSPWRIRMGYLGASNIEVSVMDPDNEGEWATVYTFKRSNLYEVPSLSVPAGFWTMSARNTTNNTALTIQSASCAGFVNGEVHHLGVRRAKTNTVTVGTSFVPVMSLRSAQVFNGRNSMGEITLLDVNVANNSSTRSVEWLLVDGALLNNGVTWTAENASTSIAETDVAATSYTNGVPIYGGVVPPLGAHTPDFHPHYFSLATNDYLVLAARTLSGSADVSASLAWVEAV